MISVEAVYTHGVETDDDAMPDPFGFVLDTAAIVDWAVGA